MWESISEPENILDISSNYDSTNNIVNFNFIQMSDNNIRLYTIHYSTQGIELEENNVIINNNEEAL